MPDGIDAAELDRRISVRRSTLVDDGISRRQGAPVEFVKRWAKKSDVSDGERAKAGATAQQLTTRFLVRYDAKTATITGKDIVVCEGLAYEVTGTKEARGTRVGIEITAIAQPDLSL